MRCLIIIMLFLAIQVNGQEGKKVSRRVFLLEEYTIDGYKMPESILFYIGDSGELEGYYDLLNKKIKKKFKKSHKKLSFEYSEDVPVRIFSLDEFKPDFKESEYDAVCVFAIGYVESNFDRISKKTGQSFVVNIPKVLYYDFYMILVEPKTNKILMKRKYNVKSNLQLYRSNRELSKVIVKEIKG